jgi:hypothetical protein
LRLKADVIESDNTLGDLRDLGKVGIGTVRYSTGAPFKPKSVLVARIIRPAEIDLT